MLIGFFSHTNDAVFDGKSNADLTMLDDETLRVLNLNMQKRKLTSAAAEAQQTRVQFY